MIGTIQQAITQSITCFCKHWFLFRMGLIICFYKPSSTAARHRWGLRITLPFTWLLYIRVCMDQGTVVEVTDKLAHPFEGDSRFISWS